MRWRRTVRRGASLVEFAIVAPLTLLLVIGLLVGGLGIFHYQQVAMLAREGSRWACVHGTEYATQTGNSAATADDIYNQAIKPNAIGLDLTKLNCAVAWDTSNSPSHAATANGKPVRITNTVTVKVNYLWIPEAFLGGINLSSSSKSVMSY